MPRAEGTFIVLEGPDGAGTTKHSALLAEALRKGGKEVVHTAEPTEGTVGTFIRSELKRAGSLSPAALQLLFCADRAEHVETVIRPALAAGKTVVCDRYVTSTIVYGQVTGVDPRWLVSVNAAFPEPDMIILTLPGTDVCLERMRRRTSRDAFESEEMLRRVYAIYERMAKQNSSFKVVDTSQDLQKSHEQVLSLAERMGA